MGFVFRVSGWFLKETAGKFEARNPTCRWWSIYMIPKYIPQNKPTCTDDLEKLIKVC